MPPIECPDDSVATAHPEQVICYSATGCTESDCCQPRLLCAVDFNEEACLALNQTFTRNASQACRDAVVCTAADCCIAGFFSFLFFEYFSYICMSKMLWIFCFFFFGGELSVRHFLCFQCCFCDAVSTCATSAVLCPAGFSPRLHLGDIACSGADGNCLVDDCCHASGVEFNQNK